MPPCCWCNGPAPRTQPDQRTASRPRLPAVAGGRRGRRRTRWQQATFRIRQGRSQYLRLPSGDESRLGGHPLVAARALPSGAGSGRCRLRVPLRGLLAVPHRRIRAGCGEPACAAGQERGQLAGPGGDGLVPGAGGGDVGPSPHPLIGGAAPAGAADARAGAEEQRPVRSVARDAGSEGVHGDLLAVPVPSSCPMRL